MFPRWERDIPTLGIQSVVDKHHLSANKGRLLQHKERLLRNKEQAKESHGAPLYVTSMSLVCRFYVVAMSFANSANV